jgi:hypothetical protein
MTEDLNNPEEKSVTVFSASTPMLFAPTLKKYTEVESGEGKGFLSSCHASSNDIDLVIYFDFKFLSFLLFYLKQACQPEIRVPRKIYRTKIEKMQRSQEMKTSENYIVL